MMNIQTVGRIFAFCAFAAFANPVFSAPITYSYAGTGTGILGTQAFNNAAFIITAQADTANITSWIYAGGAPQNTHLSTTIAITGLGLFDVTTPSHTWLAQNCCGGIGANMIRNWITLDVPAFIAIGYGLDTALGPIVDNSPDHVNYFVGVNTSGGILNFNSANSVTFTASLASVPEPGTLSVVGIGIVGLFLFRTRRRL